jgi:hypothetical protein
MSPSTTRPAALLAALLLAPLFLAACPPGTSAAALQWTLPVGGETWTAGTTHTVEWSGGVPSWSVNVQVIRLIPFQVAGAVALGTSNDGFASWTIPAGLAPGVYQLYVEEVGLNDYTYGPEFTVATTPPCATGCTAVAVAMPVFEPPAGACGPDDASAMAAAQAYSLQQLATACPGGTTLDPASIVTDVTILPVGVCLPGYGGPVVAEASSVACCCAIPTPATERTWGRLKSAYR